MLVHHGGVNGNRFFCSGQSRNLHALIILFVPFCICAAVPMLQVRD